MVNLCTKTDLKCAEKPVRADFCFHCGPDVLSAVINSCKVVFISNINEECLFQGLGHCADETASRYAKFII